MRCDQIIYLCQNGRSKYNDKTGDYETSEPIKIKRYAHINDMGDEKMNMLFGKLTEGALTVRLNAPYADKVDYIEYKGTKYEIKQRKKLGTKESFHVAKAQ